MNDLLFNFFCTLDWLGVNGVNLELILDSDYLDHLKEMKFDNPKTGGS